MLYILVRLRDERSGKIQDDLASDLDNVDLIVD